MMRDNWSDEQWAIYNQGYEDGENSGYADWLMQISDAFEGMDDLSGPVDFIKRLRNLGFLQKMHDDLVELVARAILAETEEYHPDEWFQIRHVARAAIAAIETYEAWQKKAADAVAKGA
jgi:hypothetical protein